MYRSLFVLLFLSLGFFLSSCGDKKQGGNDQTSSQTAEAPEGETATSGEINVSVDETLKPLVEQFVTAFMDLYPDAKINATYKPGEEAFADLANDSARMIIGARQLNEAEANRIRAAKIIPKEEKLGDGGMAVIIHPDNPRDSLAQMDFMRLFKGQVKNWEDLGEGGLTGPISVVYDHPNSSIVRVFMDTVTRGNPLPENAFSAKNQMEVIDYITKNPNAIGIIGLSMVSDRDAQLTRDILGQVKLMRIESSDTADLKGYFLPYQNELMLGRYPIKRSIYAHTREHFLGLGTGFVLFMAGERGQRIMLKSGLVPRYMPPRVVVLPEKEEKGEQSQ